MYLENGREIYESEKYPGYYIDANTGAFCDEYGEYVGGNQDDGDSPGHKFNDDTVWVTKSGKQYYYTRTKSATVPILLSDARRKGYRPSAGYNKQITKLKIKELKRRNK